MELQQNEIPLEFELRWKMFSGVVPWSHRVLYDNIHGAVYVANDCGMLRNSG